MPGLAASAFAFSAVGIAAGAALLLAVVLSLVLVAVVLREGATVERMTAERLTTAALLALPGALTVYLCFARGGYFPDGVASVVLLLAAVFLARNALAARPLEGFVAQASIAAGALALLAAWTLLSALWSGSVERALIEFDRVLLYALALIVFASLPAGMRNLRWMVRGLALGIVRSASWLWSRGRSRKSGRSSLGLHVLSTVGSMSRFLSAHGPIGSFPVQ